jgi:uncharacterized iron-regulated protein
MNALQRSLLLVVGCLPACTSSRLVYEADLAKGAAAEIAQSFADEDVVFLGEVHDSDRGHALQHDVVRALVDRRDVIVSMEMFERDVQTALDDYLAGRISEGEFKRLARPWPNYEQHYRPVVELAKARKLKVVAANVPRELAKKVSREGLSAAAGSPFAADQSSSPRDAYWEAFKKVMNEDLPADKAMDDAKIYPLYVAQCLKDDTMAESIAKALAAGRAAGKSPLVVHLCGSFHSDHGRGTVARVESRVSGVKVGVLGMTVQRDQKASVAGDVRGKADFVVLVSDGDKDEATRKQKPASNPHAAAASNPHAAKEAPSGDDRPGLGLMPDYESGGMGLAVASVREDSPAAAAGIRGGDTIVRLGGQEVTDAKTYMEALNRLRVGQNAEVTLLREGKQVTLEVKVGVSRR